MRNYLLFFLLLLFGVSAHSQTRRITGQVIGSADGTPIIGATVVTDKKTEKTIGTVTDINGQFSLNVPSDCKGLIISFIGMETKKVKITGTNNVIVSLENSVELLDEVVVTALGIKREAKALSYSTQGVDANSLNDAKSLNIVSSLSGKIAGVQITPPGLNNSSARIVIRGNNSVTGNNQPLFVVDGMPIDNESGEEGNLDYGNGAADINSEDVENIEVLKGANASALYGSRASNGVILITTKKGGEKFRVNINSNCMFQSITEYPEYQNSYGVGTSFYIDKNNPPQSAKNYRSWGSPMMGQLVVGLDGKLKQ